MKLRTNKYRFFKWHVIVYLAAFLFVLPLHAGDTLSVNGYLKSGLIQDSTGILTVFGQNSDYILNPLFYSQNIDGLKLSLTPQFSLSNWYDVVVLSKMGSELFELSDSSITTVNYTYGVDDSHEFFAKYSDKIDDTYLNLVFDRSASVSRFTNSSIKNFGFVVDILKTQGKYRFRHGFSKNNFVIEDNGGLSDSLVYIKAIELIEFSVPVELNSAQNDISMTDVYFSNQVVLNYKEPVDSGPNDSTISKYMHAIGYNVNLEREEYVFSMDERDIDSAVFERTFVDSSQTWDSLGFSKLEYEGYYQLLDSGNRNIFKISYNSAMYDWTALNNSAVKAKFNNYKLGMLSVDVSYILSGLWKHGYSGSVAHDTRIFGSILSSFKYEVDNNLPEYFYMRYHGNHFNWSNAFRKVENHSINYSLYHKPTYLGVEVKANLLNNWIYMDTLSLPTQLDNQISYFALALFNAISSKYLNVYSKVTYQKASSDVLRFPTYNFRNVLNYHFKIGRLQLSAGYAFNYFTSFVGLDYNPNLRRTFLQNSKFIGGIPLLDVFATVRIGEAVVFVKGENLLFDGVSRAYYLYPNRPVLPRYFRVGFSWNFKN
jgi:hypothetical protein